MAIIKFLKSNKNYQVRSGIDLIKAAEIHPDMPIKFGCRNGQCGVCAVEIAKGEENLTKQSQDERELLRKKGLSLSFRLACQCALNGDIELNA